MLNHVTDGLAVLTGSRPGALACLLALVTRGLVMMSCRFNDVHRVHE